MHLFVLSPVLIAVVNVGTGRLIPTVAAAVGLLGVILGALSCARATGRTGAIAAAVAGLISLIVGGLHAANSAGGLGTGNGLAGAIVAIVLGLVGAILAALALTRSRMTQVSQTFKPRPGGSGIQ